MQQSKFYVLKDDLVASDGFDSIDAAERCARDLRDTQRAFLLATRKVMKMFKKGVPLNLSKYTIICVVKEVDV